MQVAALTELAWHIDPSCEFTSKLRDPLLAVLAEMTRDLAEGLDSLHASGSGFR